MAASVASSAMRANQLLDETSCIWCAKICNISFCISWDIFERVRPIHDRLQVLIAFLLSKSHSEIEVTLLTPKDHQGMACVVEYSATSLGSVYFSSDLI